MDRYTFRLPDIGEGIAEAEVVAWHVQVGDRVEEDGKLADVMTDKATVEMESPVAGTVLELAGEAGAMLAIGSPLVVIEVEGEGNEGDQAHSDAAAAPASVRPESVEGPSFASNAEPEVKSSPSTGSGRTEKGAKTLASPAVRKRARDLGIDLSQVPAGRDGTVGHSDLDAFLTARAAVPQATQAPSSESSAEPVEVLEGAGEQVKVIGLRRRIAQNMAASKRHIPHYSYVEECDVTALEAMRAELNELGGDRPRLTMLPLLITAICRALPEFPMINARYDDAAGVVTRYDAVHLGMATQTDAGLMVPVIRNAEAKGLWELAAEISRLAAAARDGSAAKEELSGSTLTVTSLGPLGGIATTPVINRPEVAIIGPNRIVERPVFVPDGKGGERIEKRKLMHISISCDHRVVDGWDAANFVQALKRLLEAPMMLLAG